MRSAAGLCPDPLGSLSAHLGPLAAIRGGVLLVKGKEGREREEEGRKGRGKVRVVSSLFNSRLRA